MSIHVHGAIVTARGIAANNRGETEGNTTTLQKLLWDGRNHSSVSAESIRFALRRRLAEHEPANRRWDEDLRQNVWTDPSFAAWAVPDGEVNIDDDLLGFMSAEAAKKEAESEVEAEPVPEPGLSGPVGGKSPRSSGTEAKAKAKANGNGRKPRPKGTCTARRSPLEITRAISLTPWSGDTSFNAASPGATPSAAKKGTFPVPYGTEVHATRYQYGFALTPLSLRKPERAAIAINTLCSLGTVAGNHARFLFDFSPESVVFRITQDPSPRLLYCFEQAGRTVNAPELLARVQDGDLDASELILGGMLTRTETGRALAALGAAVGPGVIAAAKICCNRIAASLKAEEEVVTCSV